MRVIIAGPRDFADFATLAQAVQESGFEVTEVVSGGAPGVDAMGEKWAADYGLPVKRFPADWLVWGKSAGPRRNAQMADYAEALIALRRGDSPGTANMIALAKAKRLLVYVREVPA